MQYPYITHSNILEQKNSIANNEAQQASRIQLGALLIIQSQHPYSIMRIVRHTKPIKNPALLQLPCIFRSSC